MIIHRGAVHLLLITFLSWVCGTSNDESPSFVRSAVEHMPKFGVSTYSAKYSLESTQDNSNDDNYIPLRSAVESFPSVSTTSDRSGQTFVRQALESRPFSDLYENEIDRNFARLTGIDAHNPDDDVENFDAYVVPTKYNQNRPEPYRFGSPYQAIVNLDNVDKSQIKEDYRIEEAPSSQLKIRTEVSDTPKVLCYMTSWSFYRQSDGKFAPENLDTSLCTHLIYGFASLDPEKLQIREFDPWTDIENNFYKRTTSLDIPVLIGLGGWTDSTDDKYSKLVNDHVARQVFVTSLIGFIGANGFSGIHLDWTYPKCWQSDCSRGPASDKPNFTKLIHEIREAFDRVNPNLQIGVAISGYKEVITQAYELDALSKYADFLTVMSYDYHGAWEMQTGHVSPLFGRSDDKFPYYSTDYAMQLLVKNGAAKEKLIMGIPFYGQSFTLADVPNGIVGEGYPATGPGNAGEFTKQPGMLAYYEICHKIRKNKWLTSRDSSKKSGPYAMFKDQWVGYEDAASVEAKTKYAMNYGFGGIAAWTVDLDDFQNRCCSEAFPLLKAANRALGRLSTPSPNGKNCERPPAPVTPVAPVMTTVGENGIYQQATWPSWSPSTSKVSTTTWPTWTEGTSRKPSTEPSQSTSSSTVKPSTESSTWWPRPSTTKTTKRPISTTRRSTTASPDVSSTTIPSPAIVMPVFENENCVPGEFKADPGSCNSYYHCVYGEMKKHYCIGGLHWNDQTKHCDWPESANCQLLNEIKPFSMHTTRTTPPSTSTWWWQTSTKKHRATPKPMTVTEVQMDMESGCETGQYYPHKECDSFNICINNQLVPQQCGPGLYWNADIQACDFQENVNCVSARKFLQIVKYSAAQESDPCQGNNFLPYPGDCGKYLYCLHDRLESKDCAAGLHWNKVLNVCDWPINAKCEDDDSSNSIDHSPRPKPTTTVRPTYPTDKPDLKPLSGYYKVVCYFTNWAWYRKGAGRYTPDDINTDLCTHIVYGFAVLDYSDLTLKTHDSWADLENNFYTRVSDLKKKGVKVTLAIGGWNDSEGDKYSRLVLNPAARAKFVKHSIQFIEKYGFQGLDLDWEYPVCWQTDCNKGKKEEKEGFASLVKELSAEYKSKGLLLSAAVSPSKKIIDAGYDVPTLAKYFDWIAVMTYDFHGQWDKKTGHVAPLFHHPDDDYEYFNTNFSIHYWIEKGAPPRKLVLGMPLYGQQFTLADEKNNGLNAPAPGYIPPGKFTGQSGFLAYYEICDFIKNHGWKVVQDPLGRMGPYAYKGKQWVSFDDQDILRKKTQLIRSLDLGGGMVWALDLDDFRNTCGDGVHPLLTTIREGLKDSPTGKEPPPTPLELEISSEDSEDNHIDLLDEDDQPAHVNINNQHPVLINGEGSTGTSMLTDDFKVVCYFTNWAWYRQGGGKFLPEDIDPDLCTHIVYGFAVLDRDSLTIKPHDSWADTDNKFYERVTAFRAKGKKVTVAIGGWNDSLGDKYSRLVLDPAARAKFVKTVMDFIKQHGFDGLDLDWEYPVCWQVDCKKGDPKEKEGFSELVRELSEAFKPDGLLLSAAVSPNQMVIDAGYDVPLLSKYFDWIAVMTYDYHGQWDKKTGHVAPMYQHPADDKPTFNANWTIHYWIEKGADRKKLIMGMPMYGQSFSLADNSKHGLNAQTYGGGEGGEATMARGFLAYYEICRNIRKHKWSVVRDRRGRMGPYAYNRDQWVSFDDVSMIRHKSEYVKAMKLGGAMIWALDLDDFRNVCECEQYPLLRTINRVLRNYPGPEPKCKLEEKAIISIEDDERTSTEGTTTPAGSSTWWPTTSTTQSWASSPTTTSSPQTTKGPDSDGNNSPKECNGKIFAPHETDCNKYYICQFGNLKEQRCPEGLHWNQQYCDWPQSANCKTNSGYNPPINEKPTTVQQPNYGQTTEGPVTPKPFPKPPEDDGSNKVVCYFTNWAWYRPGEGKYTPDDIDTSLCTHIVYGFAVLDPEKLVIKSHDPWADIDNGFYERVTHLRRKGTRVSLAIGGWNDSEGDKYSRLVLSPEARKRFIEHVVPFLESYGFEGLDLDWEYPVCWQVDCNKGNPNEKKGFADFVRELSIAFKPRGLLLSAAVSPSKMVINAGYDVPTLSRYFDWIAVMTYDFHGHWDKQTGHIAPLYYKDGDMYDYFNANFSIHYWLEKGTPAKKLIMGVPLYGQTFTLADPTRNGLNEKITGAGEAGEYTRARGFLAYYEICQNIKKGGWTVVQDPEGKLGPYAYKGNQWVSYDDVAQVHRKAKFIKDLGLGGGMVWALDLDDFKGKCNCGNSPLLGTLTKELRGLSGPKITDCT